jgi:CheY-like chemotaxis protein
MAATVLVVDDDPTVRALLARVLGDVGYDPVVVSDGAAAVAAARLVRPDLILSDVEMPGLDGCALRAALREHGFGDVPILFMSGGRCPADVPPESFIAKPFDMVALLDSVEGAVPRAPISLGRSR